MARENVPCRIVGGSGRGRCRIGCRLGAPRLGSSRWAARLLAPTARIVSTDKDSSYGSGTLLPMEAPRPRHAVFRTYWKFAADRQAIFEARIAGQPAPWTTDEILQRYRFCNAFRAADRVSQHLIQNAAYGE